MLSVVQWEQCGVRLGGLWFGWDKLMTTWGPG